MVDSETGSLGSSFMLTGSSSRTDSEEAGGTSEAFSTNTTRSRFSSKLSLDTLAFSDQRPVVRMSNTYIKKGDFSLEELLKEIKSGMYLKGSRGGQVDPGQGIFQFY